jgi:hypothetical protein
MHVNIRAYGGIMLTDQDILEAIRTRLAVDLWPTAGQALDYQTPGAAYAAARRGAIRVIDDDGRRKRVPTAWLKRVLCLDEETALQRPRRRKRNAKPETSTTTA